MDKVVCIVQYVGRIIMKVDQSAAEYEEQRLQKIKANKAQLEQLGLAEAKRLMEERHAVKKAKVHRVRARPVTDVEEPIRRSKRLRGDEGSSDLAYLYEIRDEAGRMRLTTGSLPSSMGGSGDGKKILISPQTKVEKSRDERFNAKSLSLGDTAAGSDIYGLAYLEKLKSLWDVSAAVDHEKPTKDAEKSSPLAVDTSLSSETSGRGRRSTRAGKTKLTVPAQSEDTSRYRSLPLESSSILDYAARLARLSLSENSFLKVCPDRIYSVALHPSGTTQCPLIAAGDKEGNLGLWRVEKSESALQFRPHVSPINALHFRDESNLMTFSYDGTVRNFDINKMTFDLIYASEDASDRNWLQHGQVVPGSPSQLVLAMSDGSVRLVDTRESNTHVSWSHVLHDSKVQTVSLNPVEVQYLCTSSLDHTVKIWDLRTLDSGGRKKAATSICTYEDTRSISVASFSPDGKRVVSTQMSDKICLFVQPQHCSTPELVPTHCMAHNNKTGRYLSVLHHTWDPKRGDAFVVGSMAQPRQVEVFAAVPKASQLSKGVKLESDSGAADVDGSGRSSNEKLQRIMSLQDPDWLGSVQSRHAVHPIHNIIASGNSSGRVTVFRELPSTSDDLA